MTSPHDLPPRVGSFQLLERIGQGGMGEVWSARHGTQAAPVAVKLLGRGLGRPRWRSAFSREVRAVAALDHPGVVAVYDHGEVQVGAQAVPWLAMQLATGGSLADRAASLRWHTLARVLEELLEALAHAHARGVVHRDLKSGNVLFTAEGHAVLTDFGLAVALEADEEFVVGGTPSTMAPEQFRDAPAEIGPWTDLYSLGALTWQLVSGRRLFPGRSIQEQRAGHLRTEVPRLEARFPVPEGLEAWLRRLLRKAPEQRPAWAADARHALDALGPPVVGGPSSGSSLDLDERSTSEDSTLLLSGDTPTQLLDALQTEEADRSAPAQQAPSWRPPLPDHPSSRPQRALPVVGLGLYGLRSIDVVGRTAERDALWDALRRVHDTGRPGVVILEGRGGVGKSRLARWICRAAHEVGAAAVLRATHGPSPGPDDGLTGLAARALRCLGSDSEHVPARVDAVLRRWAPEAAGHRTRLLGLVDPDRALRDDAPGGQRAGHGPLTKLVGWAARDRSAVVWLDDVHHGIDALDFLRTVLDGGATPALFVATVRADLLPAHPRAAEALDALEARDEVVRLRLGDLSGTDRARLVQALLPVPDEVAHAIGARTSGNPLFAVQLLGAWVQEGTLVASEDGFRPADEALQALPGSIEDVWRERLGRLEATAADRDALEVAAALGVEVDTGEWAAACARAGLQPSTDLLSELQARGLATLDPDAPDARWAFSHVLLRDAVVEQARSAGRWQRWNDACAEELAGAERGRSQVRHGHHLVEAGRLEEALEPLARGAADLTDAMRLGEVYEALRERAEALEALGIAPTDERWWHHEYQDARIDLTSGRLTEADARFEALWNQAADWSDDVRSNIIRSWAWVGFQRGHVDETISRIETAIELAEPGSGVYHRSRRDLALSLAALGRPLDAEPVLWEVLPECERHGTHTGLVRLILAQILHLKGDLDAARQQAAVSRAEFEELELWDGVASVENMLGEIARHRGLLEEAEARYARASEMYHRVGSGYHVVSRVNLALLEVERDRVVGARHRFVEVLADCEAQGRDGIGNICRAGLTWAAVREGREPDAQRHLETLDAGLARTGMADVDVAQLVERAARDASGAISPPLRRRLFALAADQRRALGDTSQADRLTHLAEETEGSPPDA